MGSSLLEPCPLSVDAAPHDGVVVGILGTFKFAVETFSAGRSIAFTGDIRALCECFPALTALAFANLADAGFLIVFADKSVIFTFSAFVFVARVCAARFFDLSAI